jgi:dihydrofolate synthase/folylpolyglutamate synthase
MDYRESLAALAASSRPGMRLGLDSTRALCRELGDPQDQLKGVLVAGTNGKGSVCALVAAIARASGLRVALLTKPHLTSYRERIQLGDRPVAEGEFALLADRALEAARRGGVDATHHELLTAMGFLAAREWGAEITVCEVGLGGRLDATNVWDGGVAVVVSVGLDHQAQLGNTVAQIAGEKAAIFKRGDLAISGAQGEARPVVRAAAAGVGAELWQLGEGIEYAWEGAGLRVRTPARELAELELGVTGQVQGANAAVAVAAADGLGRLLGAEIGERAVRQGLRGVRWPGRLEEVATAPTVLVDAAHNPAAVEAVLGELRSATGGRRSVLLFGSMGDHDHSGMLARLSSLPLEAAVLTRADAVRAVEPEVLAREWPGRSERLVPVAAALSRARELAGPEGAVIALGSIYLVGEVMAELGLGLPPDPKVAWRPAF